MLEGAEQHDAQPDQLPEEVPILPLRNAVIYPFLSMPIAVSRPESMTLIESLAGQKFFGVVTQKSPETDAPAPHEMYAVGTVVKLLKMIRTPEGEMYVLVEGVARMKILEYVQDSPYYSARIEELHDMLEDDDDKELIAMVKNLKDLFNSVAELAYNISNEVLTMILNVEDPGNLADMIAENPSFSIQERQELLETLDVKARLQRVTVLLTREKEILELSRQIQSQVQNEMDKSQREYYLREQLKAIQKELGESDQQTVEIEELRTRIQETDMPHEARNVAEKELDRLSKMHPAAAEYTVSRTYLDWILDVPWAVSTNDNLDVSEAEQVLDEDHYGLEKVKKRILEYLAVRQLTQDSKGPILCFVGPPGVGKTSLGRSIARALNRKFVRISLGGIRDEAEIRGHRRTYVGALPGRIIQGLKRAGSNNPVFMLDEIDKVGTDFRGDPASALLEVLDPEQNNTFSDHYLELDFDLSKVMFITTANVLATIPSPLLDRMEVIEISGYTEEEKIMIAQQYLIPRQLQANGLTAEQLTIEDSALKTLIHSYTREAGLRNLEREIASICRGVAKEVVDGLTEPVHVNADLVSKYLGPIKFFSEIAGRTSEPGVATGLAWTPVGGDILFIEATKMRGKEKLILTGQLGDIMKESAELALSYVRSKANMLHISEQFQENTDIHIHIPSGAIPKDGPSAGVTLYTALVSLLTQRPVRSDIAMTGEITLRGLVLPVGGIKEKVLAARSVGVKNIILPAKNEKDLEEIPDHIKQELTFHFVNDMDEVIELALVKESIDAKDHPRHVAQATETVGKSEVGSAHSLA
ncbi:endopeptidase La [candidate division KSB3 bacterium]|uniref:Lon protease n=1 Tax=candidate division KSB3 bacterium TaxID=2044937 RepID=A0A9D5K0C3_9BACT|nr:endopeptidase La [candidate division KSB3 bacterium]MBD3327276.1 endopeptidase La [candidate division KSB3 bacterium]